MMNWSRWPAFLALWYGVNVAAQTSNVTSCLPDATWTINSDGQTPCLVAAFLESQCGTLTRVDAIPPGTHYVGPNSQIQDPCKCSTVTYSMVSACAVCQGRTVGNWTDWVQNCTTQAFASFPRPIPSGIIVPSWAFMNLNETGQTFSPFIAQLNATGATPPASTSSTATPTSSTETTLLPSPTTVDVSSTPESKGSNAGAIAGGVVGGLLAIAAIVLLGIWWFIRRKKDSNAVDLTFDQNALVGGTTTGGTMSHVGSYRDGPSPPPMSRTPAFSGSYYDSSELGTTIGSPITSGVYTSLPPRKSLESVGASVAAFGSVAGHSTGSQSLAPLRGYRGAAELG